MIKTKLIRTSTVALSLHYLIKGQLSFLNQYYDVIAVSGADEHLTEVQKREGIRVVNISMQRAISPLKDLYSLWRLYRLFRKERPQIVHSITPKAGLLTMLAGKLAGVPIRCHTFTGLIFPTRTGMMQQLLIKMDQILCWAATNIYPEGNGVKQDLINYKITGKTLKVIANGNVNGIDPDYFNPIKIPISQQQVLRQQLNIQPEDFVFIFIGRLVRDKGINELVTAFQRLGNRNQSLGGSNQLSRIKLLLVGPMEEELDPLLPETKKEIEQNQNIISVGFQKDVRPYFSISDALVFPSYREGFPNVVLQAGAMGLPAIVTDINGSNEIIQNDVNGIIIPSKDVFVLENAMLELFENEGKLKRLAQNARPLIIERYEQQMVWQLTKQEYDDQLKKSGIVCN